MKKSSNLTPMMKQYYDLKEQYPDAILFFRLGDFYELFDDDAIEASKIMEVTLTSRDKNAENPIPMCGVPHHSVNGYINKLVENGYKVAIAEQMEDASQVKGMVRREVVRVITPGTILDDEAIASKENNYLACVHVKDETYYLAYLDVSTGQGRYTKTNDVGQFFNEILNVWPTEIILAPSISEALEVSLRDHVPTYYTNYNVKDENPLPDNFNITEYEKGEGETLYYLFQYLYSVQKQAINHLQPFKEYTLSDYLQMNHYTKKQLELTKGLRSQKRQGSLLSLLDRTKTAMGGRMLQDWLEKPLISRQKLSLRHSKVASLIDNYFYRVELVEILEAVYDLERLVTKIGYSTATPRDLDQLRISVSKIPFINQVLNNLNEKEGQVLFEPLEEFKDLLELLDTVLVDNPPISITDGNVIKEGFNEELDRYRDALNNGQEWLMDLQMREREKTGLSTLKVGYNKVFGYYIEVSRLQAKELDDERYQRKQTLANSERYFTEELKEIEETIVHAQERSQELEQQIFATLREKVKPFIEDLQVTAKEIAELDVLASFSTISEEEGYTQAEISDKPCDYELIASRHPVVEKNLGRANFVPNDLKITEDKSILLLTGPNMSGKSTYMRQVAYCVIMNQIGCFVPAEYARLPIVDQIFTRLGSSDDIASGQSTFMVEMTETNYALENATKNSLLLLDEIGRGTATFDGMALAEAIIYYISENIGASTIFSTHYHELTQLEEELPNVVNIHVGAKEEDGEVIFEHRIHKGSADKSYGIHVAKLAGLPKSVIDRSTRVLEELEANSKYLREPRSYESEQLTLFEVAEKPEPEVDTKEKEVVDEIKGLNLNNLTPLEAMTKLYDLQDKLKD